MLDLLDADDETLLDRHGRWYLAGRDPRWLRRNALVVLGNTADPPDPRVAATLARYRHDDDDVLAEHAAWAAAARARSSHAPGMKHLLVTNDFPPKIGGIQSLLWEWWRRLPPDRSPCSPARTTAPAFDAEQPFRIERTREPVLLPHPWMVRRIDDSPATLGAELVVLDPAVPLGLVGPSLQLPYDVVLHGAEVTVPGRLPGPRQALGNVLRRARHVVAAGEYPAPRPSGPPGTSCRSRSCRPASTSTASGRSTPTSGAPPAASSGCRSTAS